MPPSYRMLNLMKKMNLLEDERVLYVKSAGYDSHKLDFTKLEELDERMAILRASLNKIENKISDRKRQSKRVTSIVTRSWRRSPKFVKLLGPPSTHGGSKNANNSDLVYRIKHTRKHAF